MSYQERPAASDLFIILLKMSKTQNNHLVFLVLQTEVEGERERGAGESSHSETGSLHTPPSLASTRTLDRSDAESVATTISQDSNKENTRPEPDVRLRRKPEYNRVST